ncbi:E3 ubiquitin-protein ligase AMFR isoform 3-T3 [Molossus nigricans]
MPLLFLERFPWPSLRTYTALSGLALLGTIVSAYRALSQPEAEAAPGPGEPELIAAPVQPDPAAAARPSAGGPGVRDVAQYLLSDSLFVWVLVNTACCVLMLMAKLIQCIVFGPLRVSERQHLKDKFWNFIFYKFIFIFGVLNVQTVGEVVMWCLWFAGLVFLHLMVQLCKDRFEYLSFSPTTPMSSHGRVLSLLMAMLLSCCGLAVICCVTGYIHGMHTLAFMAVESLLVTVRTAHVILRYLATSGYLWPAWSSSCSCVTCFMRSSVESAGTRTICMLLETWKQGLQLQLQRSWLSTTMTVPSAGTPCRLRGSCPVAIFSTTPVFVPGWSKTPPAQPAECL